MKSLILFFVLTICCQAQNVSVYLLNGLPNPKALFYGYVTVEGSKPIVRGSTLWVLVSKGSFGWVMPAVNQNDKDMIVYGDFNVDPNLIYDELHDPSKLLTPHWKTSIHCEMTVPTSVQAVEITFIEDLGKYSCTIN